jgi:hypothetical protein
MVAECAAADLAATCSAPYGFVKGRKVQKKRLVVTR